MEKVRYGVIGFGNQGSYYVKLIKEGKVPNAEVSAVCDINGSKIAYAKELYGDTIVYFDEYKKMLDSGLCDAVLVEVPHYYHPEMVIECLHRNINVISDKPAGVYTKQVKEMNEVAKKSKAIFGMMFNQRTNCVYRKMKEIIANGGIGKLQRVTWIITDWFRSEHYYKSGSWRATWKGEGGGVLINQCPHQIDLVSWVVGEMPVSVNAFCKYGAWHDIEVEDDVTAYFEYKNGATGMFITTTGEAPGTNRFEVSGTLGKLISENGKLYYYKNAESSNEFSKVTESSFDKPKCEITEPETDGENLQHTRILINFTNTLLGKEKLFVSGVEGINGVELMNAIELSGFLNGAKVTIPVDEEKYLEELNKRVAVSRYKEGNDNQIEKSLNFGTGFNGVKN